MSSMEMEDFMDSGSYVKYIMSRMVCPYCGQPFGEEGIQLLRMEDNCAILRIICSHCKKDNGIAVVGIEKIEVSPEEFSINNEDFSDAPPISEDDVIDAHKFFSNLSCDWNKYIPENLRNVEAYSDEELEDDSSFPDDETEF